MTFINELEQILKEKSLLKHPFYTLWLEGKLSKTALQGYAREYYHLEAAFPSLLLEANKKSPDKESSKILLENYSEETGEKPHAELWLDFANGLGLSRQEVMQGKGIEKTRETLDEFTSLSKAGWLSSISSLLGYEANLQETSATKIDGLCKYYGLKDEDSLAFFKVHGLVDVKHANDWKQMLSRQAVSKEEQEEAKQSLVNTMDVLWGFLDGIQERYCNN